MSEFEQEYEDFEAVHDAHESINNSKGFLLTYIKKDGGMGQINCTEHCNSAEELGVYSFANKLTSQNMDNFLGDLVNPHDEDDF